MLSARPVEMFVFFLSVRAMGVFLVSSLTTAKLMLTCDSKAGSGAAKESKNCFSACFIGFDSLNNVEYSITTDEVEKLNTKRLHGWIAAVVALEHWMYLHDLPRMR